MHRLVGSRWDASELDEAQRSEKTTDGGGWRSGEWKARRNFVFRSDSLPLPAGVGGPRIKRKGKNACT